MRRTLATQMTSAGVVLGVLVLAVVVVLLLTIRAQTRAADAVVRNGDRALAATQLRNLVVDLQSGQRGFVVTADERFLDPFRSARRTFFGPEGRALVRGVGPRGPDLDRRIRSLIVDYLEPNIRTARRDRVRAQIAVASGFGRRRVDVLRGILAGVIAEATARRRASIADLRSRERLSAGLGVAGIVLVALLIAAFTTYVVRAVVAPVRRVARAAHQIAGGRLDARVPGAEQAQAELRQMAAAFNQMASAVEARDAAVRAELDRAAAVQRALLPDAPPEVPGVRMQGACLPAGDVGGDLYDHVLDDRGRLTALVADVAGHGLGSALVMAMGRNALRRAILAGAPPHEVLEAANAELLADLAETGLFITAFCVRLDPADGTLELANAGHNPPLLRRAGGRVEALDAEGLVLGVLDDPGVEGRCLRLAPGDALLLYTDGVVEAEGPGGRLLGLPRLQEVVREAGTGGPGALVEAVLDAVTGHSYGRGVSDDVTLLALAFDGAPLRAAT